ncbi:hypothetical protein NA56DRAFT_651004, partial [Hyaloscypha hepaticicola]
MALLAFDARSFDFPHKVAALRIRIVEFCTLFLVDATPLLLGRGILACPGTTVASTLIVLLQE